MYWKQHVTALSDRRSQIWPPDYVTRPFKAQLILAQIAETVVLRFCECSVRGWDSETFSSLLSRSVRAAADSNETYGCILRSCHGYHNPSVVDYLLEKVGVSDTHPPSVMRGLQRWACQLGEQSATIFFWRLTSVEEWCSEAIDWLWRLNPKLRFFQSRVKVKMNIHLSLNST